MTQTEIKKALYREKPMAKQIDDGVSGVRGATAITGSTYIATTTIGVHEFYVPHHEMGQKLFEPEIPAQLLIRWIV